MNKKNCYFCNIKLNLKIIYDSCFLRKEKNLIESLIKNDNVIYFHKINSNSCINCAVKYVKWKNSNILKNIQNRQCGIKLCFENKNKNILNKNIFNEYDYCVICEINTHYLHSTPIHVRNNYVECVGQFCDNCYTLYN